MMAIFLFLVCSISNAASFGYAVINPDNEVKDYVISGKSQEIKLPKSKWSCFVTVIPIDGQDGSKLTLQCNRKDIKGKPGMRTSIACFAGHSEVNATDVTDDSANENTHYAINLHCGL